MSRLYYDHRETSGTKAAPAVRLGMKDYLEKVASLIPGEVIAGYLFLTGAAGAIKDPVTLLVCYWVAFAAGLVATPLYLNKVADPGPEKPKRVHIIISTAGFVVWAYVTTGAALSETLNISYDPALAAFVLGLFSLVSGLIPLKR